MGSQPWGPVEIEAAGWEGAFWAGMRGAASRTLRCASAELSVAQCFQEATMSRAR